MKALTVFELADRTDDEVVVAIRNGLPASSFAYIAKALNLPNKVLAEKLHIALRTLVRKKADRKPLPREASEKVIRLARIRNLAAKIFTDDEAIREWLAKPAPAFNGAAPLDRIDTDTGARQVEALLRGMANGHVM